MQIAHHVIAGWCSGAALLRTPRERFFCLLAGTLPDLDGIGILFDVRLYQKYHHVLGHNALTGILLSAAFAAFSTQRFSAFFIYLTSFHLHLFLDYLGSGPGWGMYYLWPFSDRYFENPHVWELQSWQNGVALAFFLVWMIVLIVRTGHTPVEVLSPRLDKVWAAKVKGFVER